MRVLITGAAGFIGSHLADRLQADGHDVFGVDNLTTGRRENFPAPIDGSGKWFRKLDIADRGDFYSYANYAEPDLVIHCAASYSDPNLWHRDTDTNVAGTINATLVARHHDARLVYFQTALPPTSSYAISKIAGEQYIHLSGVPATVFRLANMYGPRNLSGPIPTFYRRITAGEPCTVVDTRRDMVYVQDLVDAVMRAVDGGVTGKFDICSGAHLPIESLYWAVALKLGCNIEPGRMRAGDDDVKQMELDPMPAWRALDHWTPRTPLEQGVEQAVAWYRDHGVDQTYTHLSLKG